VVKVSNAASQAFLETAAPQTRLLEQRRQMQVAKEELLSAKEDYDVRSLQLRIREEALFRKDLELQDALLRLNPLLDENQAKKVREEKRAVDEERERELKEGEVSDALLALEAARAEADTLLVAKRRLQRYHTYMAAFQHANADEFPDLPSILERKAALTAANDDLKQESARLAERVDEARRVLAQGQKARVTHALTAENLTARLKERLEAVRAEVARLATSKEEGVAVASGRALEFGQMLRSVANLHARCTGLDIGSLVHHAPEDAEALGRGTASLFEGLVGEMEGAEGGGGGGAGAPSPPLSLTAALGDSALRSNGGGGGSSGGGGGPATTASGRTTLGRAPVFIAQADPAFFAATLGATAAADTGKSAAEEEEAAGAGNTGMEPAVLVRNVRGALGLLGVVGSYIEDLQATADEYAPFQAAQAKAAASKAAAAAVEASKRAAAEAAKATTAAKRESLISGGGAAPKAPPRPPVSPMVSATLATPASSARPAAGRSAGAPGVSASLSGSAALNTTSARGAKAGGGAPPPRGAQGSAKGPPGAADALLAASGPVVTAEALRVKRELEKQSIKTYFAAVSPFPPPAGAVLGGGGGVAGAGGGAGGAARATPALGDSKLRASLHVSQSMASSSKAGAPFASKSGATRR
jgi:hypothetical protein